ncbi:MAG: EAL domain-containing protein [Pseudomonadota bacterium]
MAEDWSGFAASGVVVNKAQTTIIDGQFVRDITTDPTDRIFVKSIIDIAHTMNMRIVSEFVENHDVLETVQSMGSDFAQGFGIHRPEPLESMVSMTTAMRVAGLD